MEMPSEFFDHDNHPGARLVQILGVHRDRLVGFIRRGEAIAFPEGWFIEGIAVHDPVWGFRVYDFFANDIPSSNVCSSSEILRTG